MTKKEFMGFSSAAQHDMVLEALVRVTQNLETMEKESGKPFEGTSKQRRNDIKLLTILAEAFGKNELVWKKKPAVTVDAGKYMPDPVIEIRDAKNKIEGVQQSSGHFRGCVDYKEVLATGADYKKVVAVNTDNKRKLR
jgi:hypothetical protein